MSHTFPKQRPLKLAWQMTQDGFTQYIPTHNEAAVNAVQQLEYVTEESCLYLWGDHGTGKTHLLHAICQTFAEQERSVCYLPLNRVLTDSSMNAEQVFEDLQCMDIICLDEIQVIANKPEWENALFDLFNRLWDLRKPLLLTSTEHPKACGFHLADLYSRLICGEIYQLKHLDNAGQHRVLQQQAKHFGLVLPDNVAQYLIQHGQNNMTCLMAWFEQLDYAALSYKRRLTLPFVKQVLDL
jgi:DnaA family protein